MLVSSFDTVPPHEPRRRPIGLRPPRSASGRHIRLKTRSAGSARARSPAYPARTASSHRRAGRAGGNDGRGDGTRSATAARLVRASTTMRPVLARKAGGAVAAKRGRRHPVALGAAKRQIDALGALEVEPRGQAIGGQRGSGQAAAGPAPAAPRSDQPADRTGFLAVMKQDRGGRAWRGRRVDKRVGAAARRQHERAAARRKGSAGWPSMAMTRTSWPSILIAITSRWQPLIKRSRNRSLAAGRDVQRRPTR